MAITLSDIDFGYEGEVLENTYHYDDTLPVSTNGTIAFKHGNTDEDPLIKLVFDGDLNRWQIVGVRIVRYNADNEPYNMYFLTSKGNLATTLNDMDLEDVIIELIQKLFDDNKQDYTDEIKSLFNETVMPLIEEQMTNIPTMIENAITTEIENIIDQKLDEALLERYEALIEGIVEDTFDKNTFAHHSPYSEDTRPKWMGYLFLNSNTFGNTSYPDYYNRRINTMGMEERWMVIHEDKLNDYTNSDPITQLFDQVEPWKSMTRMEILLSDLKSIKGDNIYTTETYEKLLKNSNDRNSKNWLGQFMTAGSQTDIKNRESAWFCPIKKFYFIEVEIFPTGWDSTESIYLYAAGEEEFSVDVSQYLPNITGMTLKYYVNEKCGWYEYRTDGQFTIYANLHPAFYNFYDDDLNILDTPRELDVIYYGAFDGATFTNTDDIKGNSTYSWQILPKPFLTTYVSGLTFANMVSNKCFSVYGSNPGTGVNIRPVTWEYFHAVYLLRNIERGSNATSRWKCEYHKIQYKWAHTISYSSYTITNGATWHLGDKSGIVWTTNGYYSNNYRGIENFVNIHTMIGSCNLKDSKLYHQRPHSHRYVMNPFSYDGDNYVCADYTFTWNGSNGSTSSPMVGSPRIYETNINSFKKFGCYYNVTTNGMLFEGWVNNPTSNSYGGTSDWFTSTNVGWYYALRPII